MTEKDNYAFRVFNPETGEQMKVYADGRIAGFPPGFTAIDNRIPTLIEQAREEGYEDAAWDE
jgi:hypothetical protein